MAHYFPPTDRKSVRFTIRFTPDEMKLIEHVMQSLERTNKGLFIHNTLLTAVCRLNDQINNY